VSDRTADSSVLYEMAQTMVGQEDYPTAIALRKLARAGYATLEQVDSVSDWVLLATPGIGIHRLTAVRRLVRPDWQPPRSRVIKIAERFLSVAHFALRFWSIEDLEAVMRGSVTLPAGNRPFEKRLSLEQFVQATRKALRHCEVEVLVQTLREANVSQRGQPGRVLKPHHDAAAQSKVQNSGQGKASNKHKTSAPRRRSGEDCEHFAFEAKKRREIVERFLSARARGQVANKDAWAQANYNISGRTLLRYEHEYLETGADTQP
jgi:hypothetical protein